VPVLATASLAGLALLLATAPRGAFTLVGWVTPNLIWRVDTLDPLVGLSFDDGPDPRFTPRFLEVLGRFDAQATFFVVGERAASHPELLARIRAGGHEVGNHYSTDGSLLGHGRAEFLGNLDRTERAAQIRGPQKLFRPPGGLAWPWQLRLARERGYACVLGDAYPYDPLRPPVAYMEWLVLAKLRPGSIVILHDGIPDPGRTLEALPAILAAGRERGLRFVGIAALLERSRTP
jgi:peptidoglycan/xylan/chitin deacetylase (PgdA/CDA1 family)